MSDDASLTDFVGDDDGDEATESKRADADGVVTDADDEAAESERGDDSADAVSTADDTGDTTESSGANEGDERVRPAEVEAATPTADWSPDGAECSACGAVVAHRWESEAGLVCPDCKEW